MSYGLTHGCHHVESAASSYCLIHVQIAAAVEYVDLRKTVNDSGNAKLQGAQLFVFKPVVLKKSAFHDIGMLANAVKCSSGRMIHGCSLYT